MMKGLSKIVVKYGLIPAIYAIIRLYFCLIRIRAINENIILDYLHSGG